MGYKEDGWDEKMYFGEMDCVLLLIDVPEYKLKRGEIGTIVLLTPPDYYLVEFTYPDGSTKAEISLNEQQMEMYQKNSRKWRHESDR